MEWAIRRPPAAANAADAAGPSAASASERHVLDDGSKVRINNETGAMGMRCCAVCGSFGKMKPCAGCRSILYCGRECQTQDWRRHKKACRAIQAERELDVRPTSSKTFGVDYFNAEKWLNLVPDAYQLLGRAAEFKDVILPLVRIDVDDDPAASVWRYYQLKTQAEIDAVRSELPASYHDLFRVEETVKDLTLKTVQKTATTKRVVVWFDVKDRVYVVRMRIGAW